jgi:multicomponent Na+:H+ antiporter subunit E
MKVRRWIVSGVALAVLWLFVRGVALEADVILGEFLIGLGFGLPIAFLLRRFYLPEIDIGGAARSIPSVVVYLLLFFRELLTANVDVAYRVLSPSMPIDPEVVEIPLRVESDLAITTIANSITLTPGTLTMDYDAETNTLYVHSIAAEDYETLVGPIRAWEDYALRIFDEDADPSMDPPPRPNHRATVDGSPTTDAATDPSSGQGGEDDGGE